MNPVEKGYEEVGAFGENVRYEEANSSATAIPDRRYIDVYMEMRGNSFVSIKAIASKLSYDETLVRKAIAFAKKHFKLKHIRKGGKWYWYRGD